MRQAHVAGEKLFVDYAGTTIDIFDATTGEVHACQLFVAALGASSYTYAEATATQSLPDWIGSHTRAFAFFGGVPAMVVSDNLKSGITKACFYEPAVNRAYAEMAAHYGTAIVPARPRKPRDKAKVEVAVQVATRWIIAKLRNRRFFSLPELNAAIRECLVTLNDRVSRHLGASRRTLFDATDRSALKPLPTAPYVYAEWKQCKAGLDYHVEVEKHYYSVPHALLRETLWARITTRTIELFHQSNRVAVHVRSSSNRRHTTVREHMPSSHRRYADWTPERIQRRANEIGPKTSALIEIILRERTHPEQGFRASIGILRHATSFGHERLEAACGRALDIGARSYTSVTSILKNNLDRPKARHRHGRACDSSFQHPWPPLLPLRRRQNADPSHHRSASSPQARRHGGRLYRAANTGSREGSWPCRMAGTDARSRSGAPRHAAVQKPAAPCEAAPRPGLDRGCRLYKRSKVALPVLSLVSANPVG
jgi:transposase